MVTEPEQMDDLVYFTRRTFEGGGKVMAWVNRLKCPSCGNSKMGKPVEKGKVKMRAKKYICPECNYSEEKDEHESKLILEASYTCPECKQEGTGNTSYKRKTYKGVPAYVLECEHCHGNICITKKMKTLKEKK
jgi:predicted RNA-binding Zn-ribbon protein involved in translation (DUF1610 family)